MRPYIIFMCLCLLALAVNVPAEENTETELDSPRSKEELLPVRDKTKLDNNIDIDEANIDDDDTGTNKEDNADPTDDEETNYNGDSDNGEYEEDEDKNYKNNENDYGDDKEGKADEEEPAPEETEKANTESEGFSPNEGGSRVAQGTADSSDAASPVGAQGTKVQSGPASTSNTGFSKAEGASSNQGADFQNAGANKDSMFALPPLLGDSSLSAQSNSRGSSGPPALGPGPQASQDASAVAANAVPALPPLLPVSSSNSQNGQSSPNTGSSDSRAPMADSGLPPFSNTGAAGAVPSSNTSNPLATDTQAQTPYRLPPLGPNNNLAPVNSVALKDLPPLAPNNNLLPLNPAAPKELPPLFPNSNPAPVSSDTPMGLPPLFPNSNLAPVNSDTLKELPPLIANNNMAPPVNSPGSTAGGPASLQQPSLPNSPFSSGVAGQSSYANKNGAMTGDQNQGASPLGQSSYSSKDGAMTGDQNQGANSLASSLGGQDSALSGVQAQNLGSLFAPGPVILPSGPTKTKSDGLQFPNEAKPSPTAVFGRDDVRFQTRLRTTLSPWQGFGDLSTVPTSQLQISQGDTEDPQHEDDPETIEDDPERERPQQHDEEEYQYNSDGDLGDEELPPTEPGDDGDWYNSRANKAQSQQVDEGDASDKDGKATSDNDDDTDDYYEDDYFGKGKAEEGTDEKSFQSQYQDPGHNVLEEPKSDGESRPGSEDVEMGAVVMGAVDMTTMKTKAPNKPTNMVLFYTWLILVVLIAVVTISTCKSRIVGLFNRAKKSTSHQRQPEEGKRLLEHEYV